MFASGHLRTAHVQCARRCLTVVSVVFAFCAFGDSEQAPQANVLAFHID